MATASTAMAAPASASTASASTASASAASAATNLAATGARQASAAAFRPGSGQLAVTWNSELIKILGIPGAQPATVHPTRSFALLQAAEYDAVNSVTRHDRPYLVSTRAPRDARPDAAVGQAAHDVLAALYPSMRGELGAMLHAQLAGIPGGRGRADGTRVGAAVARHLLGLRAHDGSAATPPPFVSGNLPGDYRPTPPDFLAPVFTGWGRVTPFVLRDGRQFRPAAPPPVTGATAPDPSYPGAHSTLSEAAATVLTAFDGSGRHLAITLNGVTRTFGSFQAAAAPSRARARRSAGGSRWSGKMPWSLSRRGRDRGLVPASTGIARQ